MTNDKRWYDKCYKIMQELLPECIINDARIYDKCSEVIYDTRFFDKYYEIV